MSTPLLTPSQRLELIKKFEIVLDEIIQVQKQEQEAILNRDVQKLPEISSRVILFTTELTRMRMEMDPVRGRPKDIDPQEGKMRTVCARKFRKMQELAQQNHLLLENCMRFLSRVMMALVGGQKRSTIYNQSGALGNSVSMSGILVDIKA